MRLLVASPYFPPHVGGLEQYVSNLNDELLRLGLVESITVFTPRLPAGAPPAERPRRDYRVVRYPAFEVIPNFPCPSLWRPGFWRAARRARATPPHDLVVSHTRFFLSSAGALAYARARRIPLIHVEHGADFVHLHSALHGRAARAYDLTVGRFVLRHAQAVVTNSRAAGDFVMALAGRESQVVYPGVDHARYAAVVPSAQLLATADGRTIVAFAGRLIDGKGVADLIDAFAAAAGGGGGGDGDGALLCVIGDGPRRADLEALARRRGLGDSCLFAGYQPQDRALEMMRAADVVVNPSYTEGLGLSVLEAALMGRCVLASDAGGTVEIVTDGDSALLVKPGDVAALTGALRTLLADPQLRARLGAAARAQATSRFDRTQGAERFAAVARQLIG